MKLLVIGANGRTGTEILDIARNRGHDVTAFVRSPDRLPALRRDGTHAQHPPTIAVGDARRSESIAAALAGHDAVLSAIGPHGVEGLRASTLVAECARATVDAMKTTGVRRLAIVSAAVLFPAKGLYLIFFQWLLRHHARDLREMELAVQRSGLDWTIARPPRLVPGGDERFVALPDALPVGSRAITRRSVAAFMVKAVEQGLSLRQIVGLGSVTEQLS